MKTRVYLAFDTDGALLYVGHTKLAMKQRMACHRQEDKVWPQRMARLELVEFDDPNEARSVERNLIARLDEYKARAVAAIEARMGRDANYDDGMEHAARIIRDLT